VTSDFGIDDFGPEPDGMANAGAISAKRGGMANTGAIRVADVLAKGVSIRWDEAVALLQEIVEIAGEAGGDNAPIPGFDDVLIDGEGTVTFQNTRRGERGPVAAGRALHTLLATADVPVPLRLFVTQANAPETHRSLQAFAEGLAYFDRPGRNELIRAIYQRYRSLPASAPNNPVVPPPLPDRADERPEEHRRSAPKWLMHAAVIVGIVSLAAVFWFGLMGGTGSAESLVTKAKAAVATMAPTIKSALGSGASASATTPEAPLADPKKKASAERPRQQTPSSNRVAPANGARSFEPLVRPFSLPPAPTPGPNDATASVVPLTREYVVAPHEDPSATIYSPDDADVQPPVMLYPSLPPPVFFARAGEAVVYNRMELVVAPDGRVESVRLVNGPTRMPDMMLLSGAKAWRFTPAVKDGIAVRYRTSVSWTGFP
jgi:hypothetical protein